MGIRVLFIVKGSEPLGALYIAGRQNRGVACLRRAA